MISEIISLGIEILLLIPSNELSQNPGLIRDVPNVMEHQRMGFEFSQRELNPFLSGNRFYNTYLYYF